MRKIERTSPLILLGFAVVGFAGGLLVQIIRSARGVPPLVPPVSLATTLVVIAAVFVVLGVFLRRAVHRESGPPINPFRAVRLLAGARAAQFAGALFAGFGGGLLIQVLTRSVPPPAVTWVPMLLVLIAGAVLAVCGWVTEMLCRIPPSDSDPEAPDGGAHQPSEA